MLGAARQPVVMTGISFRYDLMMSRPCGDKDAMPVAGHQRFARWPAGYHQWESRRDSPLRGAIVSGQFKLEPGTDVRLAKHRDTAVVQFEDSLHDGEPEPG